jgi:molybdate transport system substrate-binding protein
MGSRSKLTTTIAIAIAIAAGCSAKPVPTTSITVFASPSLIATFSDIGKKFRSENPGASVEFVFADSLDLAEQLTNGGRADVFAPADRANMQTVIRADQLAWGPASFASRQLVIATAPGNPERITSFADLNRPGLKVAVCAPPGTCAADTRRIQDSTGFALHPLSAQSSANGVVSMVSSGQADAGLVFLTDALAAGSRVNPVRFPQAADAVDTYTIGLLRGSEHPDLARKFIDLVTDHFGQDILQRAGFTAAPATP